MREILDVLLGKLKYKEDLLSDTNDLTKCLRQEAAKWACFFDSVHCQEEAEWRLTLYWYSPKINK